MLRDSTILLIENDTIEREKWRLFWQAEGYLVVTAVDGEAGCEEAQNREPDAVLLVHNPPVLDGFEVCRSLRALPGGAETPIIFFMKGIDAQVRLHGLAAGVDDFLYKGAEHTLLQARLRLITRLARTRRARPETAPAPTIERDVSGREHRKLELERLNRDLARQNQQLTQLQKTSQTLAKSLDTEVILQAVFDEVASWPVHLANFMLAIYDDSRQEIRCKLAMVDGERKDAAEFPPMPLGEGPISQVIRTKHPKFVDFDRDADKHLKRRKLVVVGEERMIRSALYVPLVVTGETYGVMFMQSYQAGAFSAQDVAMLETLGGQLAVSLENARLFGELTKARAVLEQRVRERTAELSRSNAELTRASRLKSEFLANMSHELRTPLNAVLGRVDLLAEGIYGPINEQQVESLHIIDESGRHLLTLINDILDLSKIEAGMVEIHLDAVSVEHLCRASVLMVQEAAMRKGLRLQVSVDPAVTEIAADQLRLKQILVNLLSNAVKFTPEGEQIGLDVLHEETQDSISFTVWDTGIGISSDDLQRLFRPFVQVNSELNRELQGTGLGLSMVSRLAELHGGSVSVTSEVGRGSRFTVTLPARRPPGSLVSNNDRQATALPSEGGKPDQEGVADQAGAAPVQTQAVSTSPRRILLAEDNETNISTFTEFLQVGVDEIMVARNGREAVDMTLEWQPDLIMMDIQMPVMNGLEAIRLIRSLDSVAATPIIALTALAMPGDRERCLAAGASHYVPKPVSFSQLRDLLDSYLPQEAAESVTAD